VHTPAAAVSGWSPGCGSCPTSSALWWPSQPDSSSSSGGMQDKQDTTMCF
jgi:hypothetical protein